jgi:hypothetical protein
MKLTETQYRAHSAISQSDIKLMARSIDHWCASRMESKEPTKAMQFGALVHTLALEPELFATNYLVVEKADKRLKEVKDLINLNPNKILIDESGLGEAQLAVQNLKNHPIAGGLLEKATKEEILFGEIEGVSVKGKLDLINKDCIVDLKTTEDASAKNIYYSSRNYGFDVQAAMYLELAKQNGLHLQRFVFICVENKAPYSIACYELSSDLLAIGHQKIVETLQVYKRFLAGESIWTGYPLEIQVIK